MAWQPGDIFKPTGGVAQAWSVIRGMVALDFSANRIEKELRASGFKVQRQNLQYGVKALKYAYQDSSTYIPSDVNQRPNASLVPNAVTEQNRPWRTTLYWDVYDRDIEDIVRKHVIVDDYDLATVDEYIMYAGQYANKYGFVNEELLDIGIESITFSDNPRFS